MDLIWRWQHNELGINWIEKAQHITGDWTLRFLLFTLCISPLRKIPALNGLIRYRRMLGLYAFFYGCLHFVVYLWYDKALIWSVIREDFTTRRFYFAGLISFLLMLPLAVTSTSGWIRRLGGKSWQRLHRLIYFAAFAGVVHYYWQGKSIVREPVLYAIALFILLAIRVVLGLIKRRSAGRVAGAPGAPARVAG